jgi:alanyl aminopeptidase
VEATRPAGPVAASAAAGSAAPAAAPASIAPPKLRLPADARPLRYDVELALDPSREDFSGAIAIELEVLAPTQVLWLNATEITVESAILEWAGAQLTARPISEHEELLGLAFAAPLQPGRGKLAIRYRGKMHRGDGTGIYPLSEGGAWYAYTQFQATDAREAFPCFDEPSFKVPWRLAIRTQQGLHALASTPVISEQPLPGGEKLVRFAETKPLPSYLVAFAVGPFDLVDAGKTRGGAPIRVVTPRGRGGETAYVVAATRPLVDLLEDYFGMPYPYEKLDVVAVPVFNAGAMENVGLITYRQELILTKPGEDTLGKQQAYAGIAAHELAHQWFGNYVTLAWWDDTWLNEAFASWMGSKIVQQWKPEWDGAVASVADKGDVMGSDSLDAARAIRQPIATRDDITNAFDDITYVKGEAVLGMIERWIGAEAFQRGVRGYMQRHAWGTATYEDFVRAMSAAAGKDTRGVFDAFVLQSGVPLVSMELSCQAGAPPALALAQERYRPTGSKADPKRTWHVPLCVRWGAGAATGQDCTVLTAAAAQLPLSAKACPDWVLPNAGGAGYYRARLRGDLLDRLLPRATRALTPAERVALMSDVNALVSSGDVQPGVALSLLGSFAQERSRFLVGMSVELIASIDDLVPAAQRPAYERLIGKLFRARALQLGWQSRLDDTPDARRLRPTLLRVVGGLGRDRAVIEQATALAWRWIADRKAVDPEVVGAALSVAARHGDQKLFERLLEEAKRSTDRVERERLFGAVGAFQAPALAQRALRLTLDPSIDLREGLGLLQGSFANPATREGAYRFVVENFDAIAGRMPEPYRPFLAITGAALCDESRRAEVEQFFRPRIEKYDGGPRIVEQALEQLTLCSASRKAKTPGVVAFLKKQ